MTNLKDEQEIVSILKKQFGTKLLEIDVTEPRRIHIKVANPHQLEIINFAKEQWSAWHLTGITALDKPDGVIAAVYHFDISPPFAGKLAITANITVDCENRKKAKLTSLTKVILGAQFFEREAHDLMGISFDGHPDLSRLVLPDGFPSNVYPLRKDFLLDIQKEEAAKKAVKSKGDS